MLLQKIRYPDETVSWTVVDSEGETVQEIRDWIVHLEATNNSPNTVQAYARHVTRLGSFLIANGKGFRAITIGDYDRFLQWLPWSLSDQTPPNVISLQKKVDRLSSSFKSQVHLAIKSFYRYLTGQIDFSLSQREILSAFDGAHTYKPFLEHINQRRVSRRKDPYLNGDLAKVQRKVTTRRLLPDQVLKLIEACHLARDAFLIVLLYNTGMRIGEALGLRHIDFDVKENVIWIEPRQDNENGMRAKGRKTRGIPVLDYVMRMYEDYTLSEEYIAAFESGTEYVFCNVKKGRIGRALSKSYADNLQKYLKIRTRISFHWHMFRHTHASEAIADGYSLLDVADRLGHSSPQTTSDFYRHLFSAEIRKLHLTGPERLKDRIQQINEARLAERDIKWI